MARHREEREQDIDVAARHGFRRPTPEPAAYGQGEDRAGQDLVDTIPRDDRDLGAARDSDTPSPRGRSRRAAAIRAAEQRDEESDPGIELHLDAETPEVRGDVEEMVRRQVRVEEKVRQVGSGRCDDQRKDDRERQPGERHDATDATHRKSRMLSCVRRKRVIRKPERVKNSAIPIGATISLKRQLLGLSGNRWAPRTSRMLTPRQPSRTAR